MSRYMSAVVVTLVFAGLSPSVSATELLVNGGFETGDLTGWTSNNVSVETTYVGVSPNSGSYMAVMGVGASQVPNADALLLQGVGIDTGIVNALEVSFAYNLQALDISPAADLGNDALLVALVPTANPSAAMPLLNVPLNDMFDGPVPDVLGWTTFSQTFSNIPDIGVVNVAFTFLLQNTMAGPLNGDEGQLFAAYIDDVSISTIPEPASLLLVCIAFVALYLWGRSSRYRRRRPSS